MAERRDKNSSRVKEGMERGARRVERRRTTEEETVSTLVRGLAILYRDHL